MPPNALDYITIRGFKSIASIDKLPLKACNVLIGANGSGKSNFIGVFEFLHAVRDGRLRNYVIKAGGAQKVLHFGSKNTKEIDFQLWFAPAFDPTAQVVHPSEYVLSLAPTNDDGLYPASESVQHFLPGGHGPIHLASRENGREAGISNPNFSDDSPPHWVRERVGDWRIYHVHDTSSSSKMRTTEEVDDNRFLQPDGSNLAAFLYFLQEREAASYSLIRRTVQRVAPFFDDFRLEPLRLKPDDIKLEWKHKNSDQYFDASSLSDGTLRFIALVTLFLQPTQYLPSVILVDEPELGLHPYAIEMLTSLIRAAAANTQVIVSTQSSLLLDHLQPEDVLVANRVDSATQITRLESAGLAEWLKDYSLGQLWEKNEFAGRPSPE